MCVAALLAAGLPLALAQRSGGRRPFGPPPGAPSENLVEKFDADEDGRLNEEERAKARAYARGRPRGGPRFGGGRERADDPPKPARRTTLEQDIAESERVAVADAVPLYDGAALRTLSLRFDGDDWYDELNDLYHTEVDVPATLVVDGSTYPEVGVRFRGNSSYFLTRESMKKSWNISLDWAHEGQNLHGYRTLNLLNSPDDPSFVREILFSEIGRDYTPAPEANHVRLVVNGEDWGLHAGFKLATSPASVLLVTSQAGAPILVDRVDYGRQTTDVAEGRLPDGRGGSATMPPSPGRANSPE